MLQAKLMTEVGTMASILTAIDINDAQVSKERDEVRAQLALMKDKAGASGEQVSTLEAELKMSQAREAKAAQEAATASFGRADLGADAAVGAQPNGATGAHEGAGERARRPDQPPP